MFYHTGLQWCCLHLSRDALYASAFRIQRPHQSQRYELNFCWYELLQSGKLCCKAFSVLVTAVLALYREHCTFQALGEKTIPVKTTDFNSHWIGFKRSLLGKQINLWIITFSYIFLHVREKCKEIRVLKYC